MAVANVWRVDALWFHANRRIFIVDVIDDIN